MKVAVYKEDDDTFGEVWEIQDEHREEIDQLFADENNRELYKLLRLHGIRIVDKCDCWITLR